MIWLQDNLCHYKVDEHAYTWAGSLSPSNICSILCENKQCSYNQAAALTNKHSDTGGQPILRGGDQREILRLLGGQTSPSSGESTHETN